MTLLICSKPVKTANYKMFDIQLCRCNASVSSLPLVFRSDLVLMLSRGQIISTLKLYTHRVSGS